MARSSVLSSNDRHIEPRGFGQYPEIWRNIFPSFAIMRSWTSSRRCECSSGLRMPETLSAAGRQLGLSLISVSRQLIAREEVLGTTLVERTTRHLSQTEADLLD